MKYNFVKLQQNTPEWLQFRRSRIGASDAPAIMGVSPYKTAYKLWLEKVTGEEPFVNSAMMRGKEMEAPARAEFERLVQCSVFACCIESPSRSYQMASLDGLSLNGDVAVEIKFANRDDHEMAKNKNIPLKYFPQLQHQLSILELDSMFYFSYDGHTSHIVEVKKDDAYINNLLQAEESFYTKMQECESPEFQKNDYVVLNDKSAIDLAKFYFEQDAIEKEAAKNKEKARQALIDMGGGVNVQGDGFRLTKGVIKGRVDYDAIPELRGVNLDAYRKEVSTRWMLKRL